MKIAIASENGRVTEHFGFCKTFDIYEVNNDRITGFQAIPNPGHRPGFLPKFLKENEVDVIISGGMGSNAVNIFNENGIDVIIGVSGENQELVKEYIAGNLKSKVSPCGK